MSTSIRELQGWGLVRPVHVLGDRRQHFESIKDVWEMFRIIIDQRKRREIDPTLEVLRLCISELDKSDAKDNYTRERLREIYEFFADVEALYADIRQFPVATLRGIVKSPGRGPQDLVVEGGPLICTISLVKPQRRRYKGGVQ